MGGVWRLVVAAMGRTRLRSQPIACDGFIYSVGPTGWGTDMDALTREPVEAGDEQEWREQARPWPRFWARLLDIQINGYVLAYAAGSMFPAFFSQSAFTSPSGVYLTGLIILPFSLVVDAAFQAFGGTTLGKAIVGVRVETVRHERLSFGTAVHRNALIYLKGLILGLPLFSLFGYANGFNQIKAHGRTSWDEKLFTRVYDDGSRIARTVLAAVLVFAAIGGGNAYSKYQARQAAEDPNRIPSEDEFAAAVPEINRGLPTQVDGATRFDRAAYSNKVMTYYYTLVGRDGTAMENGRAAAAMASPKIASVLKTAYCANASLKMYRDAGVALRYSYKSVDGKVARDFTYTAQDCLQP